MVLVNSPLFLVLLFTTHLNDNLIPLIKMIDIQKSKHFRDYDNSGEKS